jgi:hypothetical protein
MIDLDHFKRFNDTHGHMAGDTALCAAAEVIRDGLRPTDFAVRYGGEEMMAILPNTSRELAMVAERLCVRMREAVVFDDMRLPCRTSPAPSASPPCCRDRTSAPCWRPPTRRSTAPSRPDATASRSEWFPSGLERPGRGTSGRRR